MRTILLIAGKDARQRLRDRSLLLFALVLPLSLAFVFSLILGDVDGDSEIFRYGVVDQDGGAMAATFTGEFLPAVEAGSPIGIQPVGSVGGGRRLVDQGELAAVFVVPAGFTAAVESGRPATLEVIGDVDAQFGVQVARAVADAYLTELASIRLSVAAASHGGSVDPELARRAAEAPDPIALTDAAAGRRELDATTFTSAGMAVFFLFFTVQFGVSSLLDERHDGTLARLLAAPVRPVSILGGKLLVSFGIGVVSMGILVAATSLLLGADWGNPVGVAVLVVAGVVAATGVVAMVASLARTPDQASSWQAIVAVVLGVLGGAFFPVSQVGGTLATVSYLAPHRWFLQGLADLAGGDGIGVVWLPAAAMLGFAAATGGVVALRLSKVLRP